ncbi:MAG TPA: hypothetical protein VGC66_11985 [Pyrinomonadaceae bacterium]
MNYLKYLIVLGIIALIFYLLLYWRMRRYFPVVRQIFGITRQLYRMTRRTGDAAAPAASAKSNDGERLVRCASCETWVPAGRAIQLRSKASSVYCSTACLETAAAEPRGRRRSAGG